MKVAIFHDYLNQYGGAERVLEVLFEMFPQADLYTLFYDEKKLNGLFKENLKKTSFLDRNFIRRRHRYFIFLMPLACKSMKIKDNYDLIISSSAGYSKGFYLDNKSNKAYHLCYCHTPLRYAWDTFYLKNLFLKPKIFFDFFYFFLAQKFRVWDKKASEKVNFFIANSNYVAEKIKRIYQRDALVIYPPVDLNKFYFENIKQEDFYLMAGRLIYYKRFDLGVLAFNKLKKPLKIVGIGPEYKKIKDLVKSPLIEFLGNVSDEELRKLYNQAKGIIFPQIEDFGLILAEAQACGLPAIALGYGGATDIVEDKKTGLFFYQQNVDGLIEAVHRFEKINFNRLYISMRAKIFSKERFISQFKSVLKNLGFSL